jgi:hypothetical protein
VLARAGITTEMLDHQAAMALTSALSDALSNAGAGTAPELREQLRAAHRFLATVDVPDSTLRALRDDAIARAERSLAHLDGARLGSPEELAPDYADVGRIAASLRLLGRLEPAPGATPAADALRW